MQRSFLKSVMGIGVLLLLTACGGGGGGGGNGGEKNSVASSSSVAPLADQAVTFLFTNVGMTAGDTIALLASARGTGKITYTSSDTNVATVDSNGRVTGIAAGAVTITATVAADATYKSASGSYTLTVKQLASQTVTFDQPGPITVTEGDVIVNLAQGSGTGDLIYSSDNTEIATVNNQGYVIALKAGTAVITAKKYRDQQYYDGQTSFTLIVNPATRYKLSAWIGVNETLLSVPAAAGATLYGSESLDCDLLNYSSCVNSSLNLLTSEPLITTAATLSKTGHFILSKNPKESSIAITTDRVAARFGHQVVSYKNKLFLFGGYDNNYNRFNDVWSSIDGRVWMQHTDNAHLATLGDHKIVVFNNKLWAIGGISENYSDIWSSTDGLNWTQEVATAPFSARHFQQLVTFENKLWLVGGYDGTDFKNDIWNSSDGIHWSLATASATFVADRRTITGNGFGSIISPDQLIVLENKFWLFRPWMNVNTPEEMWSSTNGIDWKKESISLNTFRTTVYGACVLTGTTDYSVVAHNNQFFSIGTSDTRMELNFSVSQNGFNWKTITPYADFKPRSTIQAATFNNQLWVGGGDGENDIWTSTDGVSWTEINNTSFPAKDYSASLITFKNKLWLIGGSDFISETNSIWSSTDGITWSKETDNAEFPSRWNQQVAVHDNQLWLYGGYTTSSILNDIWVSTNGVQWTKKTDNPPFAARTNSPLVSFNNRLWLMGGRGWDDALNDVWSSADGINWTQETASAEFSPRESHSIVEFNNQLWLTAGKDSVTSKNDIWVSTDGVHWSLQTDSAAFNSRYGHRVLKLNNSLFLVGGVVSKGGDLFSFNTNDIWSSTNGVDWRLGFYHWFTMPD